MPVPSSGPLDFPTINAEFQRGTTLSNYRGVMTDQGALPATDLAFSNFRGKRAAYAIDHRTGGTAAWDLYTWSRQAGWDGVVPLIATFRIASGAVVVGGEDYSPAITIPAGFPAASVLTIINEGGWIAGRGGRGGRPENVGGDSGGPAIRARFPVTIHNRGIIAGGGGGGRSVSTGGAVASGGGGACFGLPGPAASGGGIDGGGGGETLGNAVARYGLGGINAGASRAGSGGGLAQAGQGFFTFDGSGPYEQGGSPGWAIDGNGYISWAVYGDVRGPVV